MSVLAPPAVATVAVHGSTGFAGQELLRLLAGHPRMHAVACTPDARAPVQCDLAFLALPHGVSGEVGRELAGARVPVVDLSADLRAEWPYGLPELHRGAIAASDAVANPGCYATAAVLALAPLVSEGLVLPDLVVDGKSGVSGAGKTPSARTSFTSVSEGIAPYTPVGHHHQLEIERELSDLGAGQVSVTFTPHLAPFTRGLLVTCYARLAAGAAPDEVHDALADAYAGEHFVHLVDGVRTHAVRGSNLCHLQAWVDADRGRVIVAAAIDNLVKGAAGQAIQNANLMLGLSEQTGLPAEAAWL
ncbi:MAG TPA: N-acetyl-gamma-glutamyl-phosphate reductase [Gaiellales bacterium]|nr:N-acetyl-gamma-glutamyl-phosphate reductase [Gaiellales bacterium]